MTSVFRDHQPLYQVRDTAADLVVMQWGRAEPKDESAAEDAADEPEPLVVSGGIKGANEVVGKPAILDVPFGDGHIVTFNFDPIHRYLTTSDFRLVWNAILNWNDLPNPVE